MNIKILAASAVLASALIAGVARADGHGTRAGEHSRGGWSHDSRGDRGYRDHDRGYGRDREYGGSWGRDQRGYREHQGYRGSNWNHDPRPYRPYAGSYRGYRPYYGDAPRYYAPSYYAPSYYAPGYWGGWFDDLGVVIQFDLR